MEVKCIIKKYGQGFDAIYFDKKAEGFENAKLDVAKNLISEELDLELISLNTGISVKELKKT
ncbi:hypothetical protein [uncultured Methanobrevibacter sp.]|uniref:hypothetical protein n=1 Tax=uncultured Methanobrevibacter sp. TaxID=253161 RepID=UPI0025D7C127|nr:hypothetical protein [uncultured Methanobrevibacter sp.]